MARAALLVLLLLLYLPALGSTSSGTHPDEAWYLGISAEMHAKDAWLTPTIDDVPTWYKPPLLYWAERAAYFALGPTLLAARLPSALAWVATILLLAALGARMYGERAGMLAALITATAFGWVKYARLAMMDAPMALGLTLAAYGAWRASEEDDPPWLLLVGVGAAVDFLLKGPVGAVLVLLLAAPFLWVRRRSLLLSRWTLLAFALGAALGLPWYVASFAVHGQAFYDFFVVTQNYDRFMHPWTFRSEATLLVGFLVFLLPWTFLLAGALPALRRWREPTVLLPLAWMASVLVTFTVPSLKWPHYGLTAIPGAALLAVSVPPPRWALRLTGALLGAVAVVGALLLRWPLPALVAAAIGGTALAGAGAAVAAWRGRLAVSAAATGVAMALVVGIVVPGVNHPALPPGAVPATGGRPLWVFDLTPGLYTLAAGRPVRRAWNEGEAAQALRSGGALIAFTSQLDRLPPEVREGLVTLSQWRRIPGYLAPERAWRSWRDRDPGLIHEEMRVVALPGGASHPPRPRRRWSRWVRPKRHLPPPPGVDTP
jgi:4-amino-4-deoxy-L-arabinose transferase-like glycosyltransferase